MSSKETARLRSLAGRLSDKRNSEKPKDAPPLIPPPADVHAPHGERGDFIKCTATLSPEVYGMIADEVKRRRMAGEPNAALSAILREAVLVYLAPNRSG